MDTQFILWVTITILSVAFELNFPGYFFFLSLSIGSVFALIAHLIGLSFELQMVSFVICTFIAFLILKRWVKQSYKDTSHKTNVYALQGQQAIVTEIISKTKRGWIAVQGELWAAQTNEDVCLMPGDTVEIISARGSHLVVRKADVNNVGCS